eukprot:CAMPEP_0172563436 /NCGR_PEP_ID=MMETSP1067-20121228/100654_1 /TAXON_ID=265564 ORGANISM="Thalassiosira punctigera, Strain Tpunct2005C2" /NCGR_SAMPLE_ID=MMETSP1067 /ASSEMBLY_ACC=CAM_ASM_000444 /LENGTH=449 /DNA_ID=CAMNT_0013353883 /DNA_START=140 /DNA_END=1489 /DNA_ORIENTATION=-
MLLSLYVISSGRLHLLNGGSASSATVTTYYDQRQLLKTLDPKSIELKVDPTQPVTLPAVKEELCTARVSDGTIVTESVIDNDGNLVLALPKDYETTATVECTEYVRLESPPSEASKTLGTYIKMASMPVRHVPPSPEKCNPMNFRPGYFDLRTDSWHDHCTGRTSANRNPTLPLSKETCPILRNRQEDIWVHFVGDSVMHAWFNDGVLRGSTIDRPTHSYWKTGIWRGRSDSRQIPFAKAEDSDSRIWVTFRYDGTTSDGLTSRFFNRWAHTWGDFLKVRGEGQNTAKDPDFFEDKVPDFIFWGPGYHSSVMNSERFGAMVHNMLTLLEENARTVDPPAMPKIFLMLNVMPATWKIPSSYNFDKKYRTLLNEYRKNLAMIDAAKKHSQGVVDVFSIELPFNGKQGEETAHRDAVHLWGHMSDEIHSAAANLIIDTICFSGDLPQDATPQ